MRITSPESRGMYVTVHLGLAPVKGATGPTDRQARTKGGDALGSDGWRLRIGDVFFASLVCAVKGDVGSQGARVPKRRVRAQDPEWTGRGRVRALLRSRGTLGKAGDGDA